MIEVVKPSEDISVEDCITILENIRERGSLYDEYLPYPIEYCEQLAGIEALAIDKVIERLRLLFMVNNGESESINRKEST